MENNLDAIEKISVFCDSIEKLCETKTTLNDQLAITKFFISTFISDLSESFEVAKEMGNMQAEGLIAGSIVIWTEMLNKTDAIQKSLTNVVNLEETLGVFLYEQLKK